MPTKTRRPKHLVRRAAPRKDVFGTWLVAHSLIYLARRGKTLLGSIIMGSPGDFSVFAVELHPDSAQPSLQQIIAHHAHLVVADHVKTLAAAKRYALRFVGRWKRSRQTVAECACTEIQLRK